MNFNPVLKNLSIDDICMKVEEMADDGVFKPIEIINAFGVSQITFCKWVKRNFNTNLMALIRDERIKRLVAMAEGGTCSQELAASLVGWDKVTASVALKKETGKSFTQIRKEHFLLNYDR